LNQEDIKHLPIPITSMKLSIFLKYSQSQVVTNGPVDHGFRVDHIDAKGLVQLIWFLNLAREFKQNTKYSESIGY
jgi:hypothetical protein